MLSGRGVRDSDAIVLKLLVTDLLNMGVIAKTDHSKGEVISPIFPVAKPNGKFRMILNLKYLNQFIDAPHFKMEDLRSASKLMTRNCFMGTVDLKDAYYFIPVHVSHRKFLRFELHLTF